MRFTELLEDPPKIINVGVRDFADALRLQDADVVHVEWAPPPEVDPELKDILDRLL
jgi:hypothetical protein